MRGLAASCIASVAFMNKMYRKFCLSNRLAALCLFALIACPAFAQSSTQVATGPITSQELVRLVQQLPAHPEKRDELIEEIRRRGINFELTPGLRGVVASKSGNDALLWKRRRVVVTTPSLRLCRRKPRRATCFSARAPSRSPPRKRCRTSSSGSRLPEPTRARG
jgi:hypothetical protein